MKRIPTKRGEAWLDYPPSNRTYFVSNLGRVYSVSSGKILHPASDRVVLTIGGKRLGRTVKSLIRACFPESPLLETKVRKVAIKQPLPPTEKGEEWKRIVLDGTESHYLYSSYNRIFNTDSGKLLKGSTQTEGKRSLFSLHANGCSYVFTSTQLTNIYFPEAMQTPPCTAKERWEPIEGTERKYFISNQGRVYNANLKRYLKGVPAGNELRFTLRINRKQRVLVQSKLLQTYFQK